MTLEKLMDRLATSPVQNPTADLRALREAFLKRTGRFNESDLNRFADLAMPLLAQVPLIERMAFARQLAKHRATPRELLTLLTNDHYLVSAPVLESAPMLTEEDLKTAIERYGAPVCLAISKRDELSVQLTDMLMSDAEEKVQRVLAGNTGARLSRKSMISLCDRAETDKAMRDALCRRRDLPQALASRLRALGTPDQSAERPKELVHRSGGAGVGRAGIVLSADLLNAKPKPKAKTIRYS